MSRVSPTLHQLAQAWPADPLRPTVQFGQVLSALSTSPNLRARAVMAARALSEDRLKTQVCGHKYVCCWPGSHVGDVVPDV